MYYHITRATARVARTIHECAVRLFYACIVGAAIAVALKGALFI